MALRGRRDRPDVFVETNVIIWGIIVALVVALVCAWPAVAHRGKRWLWAVMSVSFLHIAAVYTLYTLDIIATNDVPLYRWPASLLILLIIVLMAIVDAVRGGRQDG